MKKKLFSIKDKFFLSLFTIGCFAICYATYKVIGIKSGEQTFSIVRALKTSVVNFIG